MARVDLISLRFDDGADLNVHLGLEVDLLIGFEEVALL
jgi:hypothetical protein